MILHRTVNKKQTDSQDTIKAGLIALTVLSVLLVFKSLWGIILPVVMIN